MRVIVCGSRDWRDPEPIRARLRQLPPDTVIVHGACRGADLMAGFVAQRLGLRVEPVPANWRAFGMSAGPIRNRAMLRRGADLVLAFGAEGRGTKNMLRLASVWGVPAEVCAAGEHVSPRWSALPIGIMRVEREASGVQPTGIMRVEREERRPKETS